MKFNVYDKHEKSYKLLVPLKEMLIFFLFFFCVRERERERMLILLLIVQILIKLRQVT